MTALHVVDDQVSAGSCSGHREIAAASFDNGWRGRFNAWFFTVFDRYIQHVSRAHKEAAFGDLQPGVIVEIGPGVGGPILIA